MPKSLTLQVSTLKAALLVRCLLLSQIILVTTIVTAESECHGVRHACQLIETNRPIALSSKEVRYGSAEVFGLSSAEAYNEKNSETVSHAEHRLCDCRSEDVCGGEADESANFTVQVSDSVSLKLCQHIDKLPVCKDFRRPAIRLHRLLKSPVSRRERNYTAATVWCHCQSGHFRKRTVEAWHHGWSHVEPYICDRD